METRLEESRKTYIDDELDNGYSISMVVDHLDDEAPYEISLFECMGWSSEKDLLKIKAMINAALRLKKKAIGSGK